MPKTKGLSHSSKRARASSSNDPLPSKPASLHPINFQTSECATWYAKRASNKIIVEKTFKPSLDHSLKLSSMFRRLGWSPIITLRGNYCPALIKEFYANMMEKKKNDLRHIETVVKGVPIEFDRHRLATILGVNNEGPWLDVDHNNQKISSELEWNFRDTHTSLGMFRRGSVASPGYLSNNDLAPQLRALVYIFAFNVFPKASGLNEARVIDVYILHKMLQEQSIPLTPLIITSMREVVAYKLSSKAYVFPLVIMQILNAFGVSTEGEITELTTSRDIVTEQTLSNCGYRYNDRERRWMKPHEVQYSGVPEPPQQDDEVEPPPPPPRQHAGSSSSSHVSFEDEMRAQLGQLRLEVGNQAEMLTQIMQAQQMNREILEDIRRRQEAHEAHCAQWRTTFGHDGRAGSNDGDDDTRLF